MSVRVSDHLIQQIRSQAPLGAVLAEAGIELKRRGKSLWACCPLPTHEDATASFQVREDKNTFTCFGCHESGSAIDFVMKTQGLEFMAAVKSLNQRFGIVDPALLERTQFSQEQTDALQRYQSALEKILATAGQSFGDALNRPSFMLALAYHDIKPEILSGIGMGYLPISSDLQAITGESFARLKTWRMLSGVSSAPVSIYGGHLTLPLRTVSGQLFGAMLLRPTSGDFHAPVRIIQLGGEREDRGVSFGAFESKELPRTQLTLTQNPFLALSELSHARRATYRHGPLRAADLKNDVHQHESVHIDIASVERDPHKLQQWLKTILSLPPQDLLKVSLHHYSLGDDRRKTTPMSYFMARLRHLLLHGDIGMPLTQEAVAAHLELLADATPAVRHTLWHAANLAITADQSFRHSPELRRMQRLSPDALVIHTLASEPGLAQHIHLRNYKSSNNRRVAYAAIRAAQGSHQALAYPPLVQEQTRMEQAGIAEKYPITPLLRAPLLLHALSELFEGSEVTFSPLPFVRHSPAGVTREPAPPTPSQTRDLSHDASHRSCER